MKLKEVLAVTLLSGSVAFGGQVDNLVNKLVEKGTLSGAEGREIITNTQEETKNQIAKGTEPTLPLWLQTFKMGGDFRLRYERDDKDGAVLRERERIRVRFGVEAKASDNMKFVMRLATGTTDPKSTNQTLGQDNLAKPVGFDQAYGEYTANEYFLTDFGKMKNPIFSAADMIWDADITPEGIAPIFTWNGVVEGFDLFLNTGWFVLDELAATKNDPTMYFGQPGFRWQINDDNSFKLGATVYGFKNIKGTIPAKAVGTNSGLRSVNGVLTGGLTYDYNCYSIDADYTIKNVIPDVLPTIGVLAQYIKNPDPSVNNKGYLYGLRLGSEKVSDPLNWQLIYTYRKLEKDAWLDIFPDSDTYGGKTGIKGNKAEFILGVAKNTGLRFAYWNTQNLTGTVLKDKLFMADLNVKY